MARENPTVVALRRENEILRAQIERMRQEPPDVPFVGCDNSCVVARPGGMATNGGCRCDEAKLRRAVQWWRRRAEFLQVTVQEMRHGQPGDCPSCGKERTPETTPPWCASCGNW